VDIQHLKYFISVAEHLNFTRAAEEHHIAQPSISQIISSLKNGWRELLDRQPRRITHPHPRQDFLRIGQTDYGQDRRGCKKRPTGGIRAKNPADRILRTLITDSDPENAGPLPGLSNIDRPFPDNKKA
jgi:hypothetical protein